MDRWPRRRQCRQHCHRRSSRDGRSLSAGIIGSFDSESHLITFNQSQWLGNYVATKVVGLKMDLQELWHGGVADCALPFVKGRGSGQTTPGYSSTTAFSLPTDGQWHKSVFFPLNAGTMTAINGPKPLATDLASVLDFRLLSSTAPNTVGDVRRTLDSVSITLWRSPWATTISMDRETRPIFKPFRRH